MNDKVKSLAVNGILASIYIVLTVLNPIGYGAIQLRISEAFTVLPLLNRKFFPSIFIGVLIANLFSPLGFIDVLVGLLIAFIIFIVSYKVRNIWANAVIYAVTCGVFVGAELFYVLKVPFFYSFVSVGLSQLIIMFIAIIAIRGVREKIENWN